MIVHTAVPLQDSVPRQTALLLASAAWEGWPEVSPDGRWLGYVSNASGRYEVYVRPYPLRGAPMVVSLAGGISPVWHPGGGQLFYVEAADEPQTKGRMMAVEFGAGSPPRVGSPRPLFEFDRARLRFVCRPMRCYDVARDGKRFYAIHTPAPPPSPVVTHVSLVQNWVQELRAKVPVHRQTIRPSVRRAIRCPLHTSRSTSRQPVVAPVTRSGRSSRAASRPRCLVWRCVMVSGLACAEVPAGVRVRRRRASRLTCVT